MQQYLAEHPTEVAAVANLLSETRSIENVVRFTGLSTHSTLQTLSISKSPTDESARAAWYKRLTEVRLSGSRDLLSQSHEVDARLLSSKTQKGIQGSDRCSDVVSMCLMLNGLAIERAL
jgi:hypothetical protein